MVFSVPVSSSSSITSGEIDAVIDVTGAHQVDSIYDNHLIILAAGLPSCFFSLILSSPAHITLTHSLLSLSLSLIFLAVIMYSISSITGVPFLRRSINSFYIRTHRASKPPLILHDWENIKDMMCRGWIKGEGRKKKRKWTKEYINYDTYSMGEDNNKKYGIEAQYPPLLSSNQHKKMNKIAGAHHDDTLTRTWEMANRQTKGLDERRKFHSTIGLIYNSLPTTTKLQTVPGETHQDRSCCHLSLSRLSGTRPNSNYNNQSETAKAI